MLMVSFILVKKYCCQRHLPTSVLSKAEIKHSLQCSIPNTALKLLLLFAHDLRQLALPFNLQLTCSLHYLLTVYTSLINQIISEHSANFCRVTYISTAPENWSCSLFVLSTKVIVWMVLVQDRV